MLSLHPLSTTPPEKAKAENTWNLKIPHLGLTSLVLRSSLKTMLTPRHKVIHTNRQHFWKEFLRPPCLTLIYHYITLKKNWMWLAKIFLCFYIFKLYLYEAPPRKFSSQFSPHPATSLILSLSKIPQWLGKLCGGWQGTSQFGSFCP